MRVRAVSDRLGSRSRRLIEPPRPCSIRSTLKKPPPKGEVPAERAEGFVLPALHVRGGSVSRRGLTQLARNRAPPHRRNQLSRTTRPKRQPLFGREGSGGRGASLREAASPPRISRYLPPSLGEGARGRGLLYREVPSLANDKLHSLNLSDRFDFAENVFGEGFDGAAACGRAC